MSLLILGLGIAGFLAVVWLFIIRFWACESTARAHLDSEGVQELEVVVDAGYHPEVVVLQQGRPTRLNFVRRESGNCSEWVIFPSFGVSKKLEPFKTTAVELIPREPGEFVFTCKFNVCRGKLIVEKRAL
ncbi:MAG: cupredoxin domain-containing protein [Chloroflexi bacterium]|nr:cupredoxin domain-containing protein [Chloroflexota bacterium]